MVWWISCTGVFLVVFVIVEWLFHNKAGASGGQPSDAPFFVQAGVKRPERLAWWACDTLEESAIGMGRLVVNESRGVIRNSLLGKKRQWQRGIKMSLLKRKDYWEKNNNSRINPTSQYNQHWSNVRKIPPYKLRLCGKQHFLVWILSGVAVLRIWMVMLSGPAQLVGVSGKVFCLTCGPCRWFLTSW